MKENKDPKSIAIIGAGPAGLTAGYLLAKAGQSVTVFEADPVYVGGISRTEAYKGNYFDIGGHRFFSKSQEVEDFWTEILGNDMLNRPRSSRIFYKKKFFKYPLSGFDVLSKLGIVESTRCMLSYTAARIAPKKNPLNFEDWVSNQFGKRLFQIFFKTYTEKVWGISCKEISADWAAQRIKGLSLSTLIVHTLFPQRQKKGKQVIKTLIDSFRYPRRGPGMMWEVCAEKATNMGMKLLMGKRVKEIALENKKWKITLASGEVYDGFDYTISSAPMGELIPALRPPIDPTALAAAGRLGYRDFITVVLIVKDRDAFDDNWIYIHDPSVKVGRVQNFKSWSPEMVADPTTCTYGLEYFCFENDGLWNSSSETLIDLAKKEFVQIGLAKEADILDGYVVRQKKAYPVYDQEYKENIQIIKEGLKKYEGLILVGRNGMHKYNNQDHSMMTSMLAVRNILAGDNHYDLWDVNEDASYHETDSSGDAGILQERAVPIAMPDKSA